MPTPAAISALRETLAGVSHADDLDAMGLSRPVIATQLSTAGVLFGLADNGEFASMSRTGHHSQHQPLRPRQPLQKGWISDDGQAVVVLTSAGDLERWSTQSGTSDATLARSVTQAAINEAQTRFAVARSQAVSMWRVGTSGSQAAAPVCTVLMSAEVTALAISPSGGVAAMGQADGTVTVADAASCVVNPEIPYPIGMADFRSAVSHVSIANDARAVGFTVTAAVVIARPAEGGGYAAEGFTDVEDRAWLSEDGRVAVAADGDIGASIGDPLDALDVTVRTHIAIPGSPSGHARKINSVSIERAPGGWAIGAGTAQGGLFFAHLDGVASTSRAAPPDDERVPNAGNRFVALHPARRRVRRGPFHRRRLAGRAADRP